MLYKTATVTPKKDEAELLEFSFATPTSSGDTIKRAKMKTAETDSYKGRVVRVQDDAPVTKYYHDVNVLLSVVNLLYKEKSLKNRKLRSI